MKTSSVFTTHPASVGESYAEHLRSATGFAVTMLVAGLACLLHGVFPFLFVRTGSDAIRRLYDRMVLNRMRDAAVAAAPATPETSSDKPMPAVME